MSMNEERTDINYSMKKIDSFKEHNKYTWLR